MLFLIITGVYLSWYLWKWELHWRHSTGCTLEILLIFLVAITVEQLVFTIQEYIRFRYYRQVYDVRKIQQQLNNNPVVIHFFNKLILFITDEYFIFKIWEL